MFYKIMSSATLKDGCFFSLLPSLFSLLYDPTWRLITEMGLG